MIRKPKPEPKLRKPGGKGPRQKGDRFERWCVHLLCGIGVPCRRVPLSGSAGRSGQEYAHDLRVTVFGEELPVECKDRQRAGLSDFYEWLKGGPRYLFVRRSNCATLVVMPIEEFTRLVNGGATPWSA
jgi:hypothetical protein